MKKIIFLTTLLVVSLNASHAYEVKNVCAKYQTNYSWSSPYQVQTQIYSGQELNKAVGSFNRYDFISHYAVIFWSNSQASVIKINSPYYSGMMMYLTNGVDQQGRQWQLSDNNFGYCL